MSYIKKNKLLDFFKFFSKNHFQRLPFNWRTPIGYFVAFTLQCGGVYYLFMYVVINCGYFTGSVLTLIAFVNDAKQELKSINALGKIDGNKTKIIKGFGKFIELHAQAKQLS